MPTYTIYADEADLENFGVGPTLLEDERIDQPMIDSALSAASRLADGYLSDENSFPFTLPLTQLGEDLRMNVAWIAAYLLLSSAGFAPEEGANETYRLRYEDALKWLKGVGAGDITLHGTVGTDPGPPTPAQAARRPIVISGTSRGFSSRGDGGDRVVFDLNGPRGGFVGD